MRYRCHSVYKSIVPNSLKISHFQEQITENSRKIRLSILYNKNKENYSRARGNKGSKRFLLEFF